MDKVYFDICKWNNKADKFFSEFEKKSENREQTYKGDLRLLEIDHIKLYCLLKAKASNYPNGIYTMLMQQKPIGNLFWWDFIIESEIGFIHFYRSQSKIETMTNIKDLDIKAFIEFNYKKYFKEINITKNELEIHTLLINHYDSYAKCVSELWKEINKLNISPTKIEIELENDIVNYQSLLEKFISDNIKFHAFGKSLLLNSAFLVEAYINMIIRLSAKPELKKYPEILKKHLSTTFSEKLKNLKYYSSILKKDVDLDNEKVINALKVIAYRNKYVHSDLNSKLNEIGEVNFDGYFPIFPSYKYSPIIENIVRTYQTPSYEIILFSYKSSLEFINYIKTLFDESELTDYVDMILNQNPIGFNQMSKNYSAIFSNRLIDFKVK